MWALQPERKYLTEERVQEWKGLNGGFKLPEPAQTLRFLYELCWSMVLLPRSCSSCSGLVLGFRELVLDCGGLGVGSDGWLVVVVGQVHGGLAIPKFRAILDSIEFSDRRSAQDVASLLADVVAQMGQDVRDLALFLWLNFIVLALFTII